MQDGLVGLMGELARIASPRSSTPRPEALGIAYRKIVEYAEPLDLGEAWCDNVMMLFLREQHEYAAA